MFPQSAIPLILQKAPFIMVKDLLFADETTARTSFLITAENVLTVDGIFQEGGILENIAQTAATHAGYKAQLEGQAVKPGFIGSVKDFTIEKLPLMGDTLQTEVTIIDQINDVTIVTSKVWCNNNFIAGCEMRIFIQGDAA